jgi:hypothetical protein
MRCRGLKIVRATSSCLQHENGLFSIMCMLFRCFTFATALNIVSENGGNFMAVAVDTVTWSAAEINGTAMRPSQIESVLFLMFMTACASLRKSTPSIASNAKFGTTENVHGTPKPAILTSVIISAVTGIGVESAANNLSFVAFGLTVYAFFRMR